MTMRRTYHDPDQPAPRWTYVLEVFERSADPTEPRNSPQLLIGKRWFRLQDNLLSAARQERDLGRYVEAYYVVSNDTSETVRL